MLFPTMLVGSYPQPEWLINRNKLAGRFPPRVRAKELWRIPEPYLAEAQDDATVMAIKAQEEAGLDIITDGEIRRESYSNRFASRPAKIVVHVWFNDEDTLRKAVSKTDVYTAFRRMLARGEVPDGIEAPLKENGDRIP